MTLSIIIPNYARTFDTMDLLCNSISGLIGYMLYKFYNRIIVNSIEIQFLYILLKDSNKKYEKLSFMYIHKG